MRLIIYTLLAAVAVLTVPLSASASGPRPCDIDGTPCEEPGTVATPTPAQPSSAPVPAHGGGSCVAPCVATVSSANIRAVSFEEVHPTPTSEAAPEEDVVAAAATPSPEPTAEPSESPSSLASATEPPSDNAGGDNWPLVAGLLLAGGAVIKLATFLA